MSTLTRTRCAICKVWTKRKTAKHCSKCSLELCQKLKREKQAKLPHCPKCNSLKVNVLSCGTILCKKCLMINTKK